jgi:pimeloyl-ACP methyl ester carboxylesterase
MTFQFRTAFVICALVSLFGLHRASAADVMQLSALKKLSVVKQVQQLAPAGPPTVSQPGIFKQRLDHTSLTDSRTFDQRYWITNTLAKSSASPVILYLCGEGACGSSALTFGPLPQIARDHGAYIVSLEHRYYGKSQPFTDLSTSNLRYLSTEQAIEDIRSFREGLRAEKRLTGPWILVGGSYAGALAAYTRSRHPQEFVGALASSASVRPLLDFDNYDLHVATLAGKSCVASLQSALSSVERETETKAGFETIRARFRAESVMRRDDFLYLLSDITSASVQLGLKDEFCKAVADEGVDGLLKMKLKVDSAIEDFSKYASELSTNTDPARHAGSLGMRQWFYQSCTEFGFWQNAYPDVTQSARSKEINRDYHDELCRRLFQLPKASDVSHVERTYFEPLMTSLTSNILFTVGTRDPWRAVGMTSADVVESGPHVRVVEIAGGFHCDDLGVGGTPEVKAAKEIFRQEVRSWLTTGRVSTF